MTDTYPEALIEVITAKDDGTCATHESVEIDLTGAMCLNFDILPGFGTPTYPPSITEKHLASGMEFWKGTWLVWDTDFPNGPPDAAMFCTTCKWTHNADGTKWRTHTCGC